MVSNRPTVVYNQVVLYSNQVVQGNFEHTFVALHAWVLAFRLSYCENMFISLSSALLLEIKQACAHLRAIMTKFSYIKLNVWPLKQTEVLRKIEATSVIYWTFMIIDNQSLKQQCVCDPNGRKHMERGIDLGSTQQICQKFLWFNFSETLTFCSMKCIIFNLTN